MKYWKFVFITLMLFGLTTTITAKEAYKAAKVYMFGFAASFNDSTIYMTNIQKVDAYLVNDRTHFLANREDYSYQLRSYLQNSGLEAYPTCATLFAESERAAMKKYLKLRNRYEKAKKKYVIKGVTESQFNYKTVEPDELSAYGSVQTKVKKGKKSKKKAQAVENGDK